MPTIEVKFADSQRVKAKVPYFEDRECKTIGVYISGGNKVYTVEFIDDHGIPQTTKLGESVLEAIEEKAAELDLKFAIDQDVKISTDDVYGRFAGRRGKVTDVSRGIYDPGPYRVQFEDGDYHYFGESALESIEEEVAAEADFAIGQPVEITGTWLKGSIGVIKAIDTESYWPYYIRCTDDRGELFKVSLRACDIKPIVEPVESAIQAIDETT